MKITNLEQALEEAERLTVKASELLKLTNEVGPNNMDTVIQGALSASVRRLSLELTKSLAKLRRSDWEE